MGQEISPHWTYSELLRRKSRSARTDANPFSLGQLRQKSQDRPAWIGIPLTLRKIAHQISFFVSRMCLATLRDGIAMCHAAFPTCEIGPEMSRGRGKFPARTLAGFGRALR